MHQRSIQLQGGGLELIGLFVLGAVLAGGAVVGFGVYSFTKVRPLTALAWGTGAAAATFVGLQMYGRASGAREHTQLVACLEARCGAHPEECTRGRAGDPNRWYARPNTMASRCFSNPKGVTL